MINWKALDKEYDDIENDDTLTDTERRRALKELRDDIEDQLREDRYRTLEENGAYR